MTIESLSFALGVIVVLVIIIAAWWATINIGRRGPKY